MRPPPTGMAVENRKGAADAALVAPVGCVVERPLEGLLLCQVLRRRRQAGVQARWADAGGAKSQAVVIRSFPRAIHTSAEWLARLGSPSVSGGAGGDQLSLCEDGAHLPWRLRRRRGPPQCVCGCGLLRMGWPLPGHRSGRELGRTSGGACLGQRRGCGGGLAVPFERGSHPSQRGVLGPPTNQAPAPGT